MIDGKNSHLDSKPGVLLGGRRLVAKMLPLLTGPAPLRALCARLLMELVAPLGYVIFEMIASNWTLAMRTTNIRSRPAVFPHRPMADIPWLRVLRDSPWLAVLRGVRWLRILRERFSPFCPCLRCFRLCAPPSSHTRCDTVDWLHLIADSAFFVLERLAIWPRNG